MELGPMDVPMIRVPNFGGVVAATAMACHGQNLVETFENVSTLPTNDWHLINLSSPLGTSGWHQGDPVAFVAFQGQGYIASDYTCGSGAAILSNWLVLPPRRFLNGDSFHFVTRTLEYPAAYPDRLQLRLSREAGSSNVGTTATDVGDFTTLLLDINPTYSSTGYSGNWQGFLINLSGLPVGGYQGRLAFRYFVEDGGTGGSRSTMVGIDSVTYSAHGARGACCLPNGTCHISAANDCIASNGIHHGVETFCETISCLPFGFQETNDAGDLPEAAVIVRGPTGVPLLRMDGSCAFFNGDVFKINVCDRSSFSLSVEAPSPMAVYLLDLAGRGIVRAGDGPPVMSGQFIPANGDYYIAIAPNPSRPKAQNGAFLWDTTGPSGTSAIEWAPNGAAAGLPMRGWQYAGGSTVFYTLRLTGACWVSQSCRANCDQSTTNPVLTSNDFICFLTQFAQGNSQANCDLSSTPPLLTANDFQCFLIQYANGCS
jgi:hypothetical protein